MHSRCESRSLRGREFHRSGRRHQHLYPQHAGRPTSIHFNNGGWMQVRIHYSSSPLPPCPPHPRFWAESPLTIRRRASRWEHSLSFEVLPSPQSRRVLGSAAPLQCSLTGKRVLSLALYLSRAGCGWLRIQRPLAASYVHTEPVAVWDTRDDWLTYDLSYQGYHRL